MWLAQLATTPFLLYISDKGPRIVALLMVLKDFSSKKNRDLQHAYHARFLEREKDLINVQWTEK